MFSICQPYLGYAHIIFMDNWYTSPFIIRNLLQVDTGACGTCKQNRRGLPNKFSQIKLKQSECVEFTYDKEITLLEIFD